MQIERSTAIYNCVILCSTNSTHLFYNQNKRIPFSHTHMILHAYVLRPLRCKKHVILILLCICKNVCKTILHYLEFTWIILRHQQNLQLLRNPNIHQNLLSKRAFCISRLNVNYLCIKWKQKGCTEIDVCLNSHSSHLLSFMFTARTILCQAL